MITVKDFQKATEFPRASKDESGRLRVGAAIGTTPDTLDRVAALREAGVDVIVLDTSHGHSRGVLEMIARLKARWSDLELIAGNIVTREAALDLVAAGADAVKVGIGPGLDLHHARRGRASACRRSRRWRMSLRRSRASGVPLIADGGIRYSGDLAKAIAAGAHAVMIGGMFAGTEESPGDVELYQGASYKAYRGMGSLGAMSDRHGSADRYFQDTCHRTREAGARRHRRPRALQGQPGGDPVPARRRTARRDGLHRQRQHRADAHAADVRAHHHAPACARATCTT